MGDPITDLLAGFTKNQLIGFFLIIWAATFFFSALSGLLWLTEGHWSILDLIVDGLWNLTKIGCAIVLAMLGLKILNSEE